MNIKRSILSTVIAFFLLGVIACSTDDATNNSFESSLLGEWRVVAIEQDSIEELAPEDTIRVIFTENDISGEASGICGNYFSGNYTSTDQEIQFTDLTSTEAACPASHYWMVYTIIEHTDSWLFLSADTLVMVDIDSGDRLLLMKND